MYHTHYHTDSSTQSLFVDAIRPATSTASREQLDEEEPRPFLLYVMLYPQTTPCHPSLNMKGTSTVMSTRGATIVTQPLPTECCTIPADFANALVFHEDRHIAHGLPTPRSDSVTGVTPERRKRSFSKIDTSLSTCAAGKTKKPRIEKSTAAPRRRKERKSKADGSKRAKLTAPLSVLTRGMHAPIRDIESWVNRPAQQRLEEVERRNGYITRPMNSFMLYRSAYAERTKEWCFHNNHQVVSSVSGESWPLEPPEIREQFDTWAKIERVNHQAAHPEYKFSPSKSTAKRKDASADAEGLDRVPTHLPSTLSDRPRLMGVPRLSSVHPVDSYPLGGQTSFHSALATNDFASRPMYANTSASHHQQRLVPDQHAGNYMYMTPGLPAQSSCLPETYSRMPTPISCHDPLHSRKYSVERNQAVVDCLFPGMSTTCPAALGFDLASLSDFQFPQSATSRTFSQRVPDVSPISPMAPLFNQQHLSDPSQTHLLPVDPALSAGYNLGSPITFARDTQYFDDALANMDPSGYASFQGNYCLPGLSSAEACSTLPPAWCPE